MGRIYLRTGIYYIDVSDGGSRIRQAVGPDKKLAELALKKLEIEKAEGKFLEKRKRVKIKFKAFGDIFMRDYSRPNKRNPGRDVSSLKHLMPFFQGKNLFDISVQDIERYRSMRLEKVSKRTVDIEVSCLRCMFNRAIDWGYVDVNPVSKIKFYREENRRDRYLELEEIKLLTEFLREPVRNIFLVSMHTGMRLQEVCGLKWQDVDVNRQVIAVRGDNTKTGMGRKIPMNRVLLDLFNAINTRKESAFIFPGKNLTSHINKDFITHQFKKALDKLGIKDACFHTIRHSFASHFVMCGGSLEVLREILGHRDYRMTLRYAHLSPNFGSSVMDVLGQKIGTNLAHEEKQHQIKEPEELYKALTDKGLSGIGACSSTGQSVGLRSQRL